MLFSLYLIAANPRKQEKLRAEVMKHVPSGTPVTSQALDKMTYLRASIKEGFRYQLGWTTTYLLKKSIKYRNLGNIAFIIFMLAIDF